MDRLTQLLKEHQVGEWCKRAAWVIVALTVIENVIDLSFIGSQPFGFFGVLRFVLAELSTALLYFFLLYAAGVIVNRLVAMTERDESEQEEEESEVRADEEEREAPSGQVRS